MKNNITVRFCNPDIARATVTRLEVEKAKLSRHTSPLTILENQHPNAEYEPRRTDLSCVENVCVVHGYLKCGLTLHHASQASDI